MATFLTLDLGTTYFKAALFDGQGGLMALGRAAPPVQHPQPGWWEMPADDFRSTVLELLEELRRSLPDAFAEAAAVSFATQTNSFLLLDNRDRPLTPVILWPDQRAADVASEIRLITDRPDLRGRTGVPEVSFQFMLPKLLWLRRHQHDRWQQCRKLCLLSDYLTLWLTGRHVTEGGAAGLTGAVEVHRPAWDGEVVMAVGLQPAWLPGIACAGTDLGPILPEAVGEWGLPGSCRFVVGCLDQYAGAIGLGCVWPGDVCETTGTVLATVRLAPAFDEHPQPGVFQGPSFRDGAFWQMVFGSTSANLLEHYRESLPGRPGFAELDRLAQDVAPGSEGLRAVGSPEGRLSFVGQRTGHGVGHHVRAVLETVAYALADQVAALCGGSMPQRIRSGGGAARSDLWLQIKSDVLGIPVEAVACPEPTSMGAAMLAAATLGGGTVEELAARWVCPARTFRPRADAHRAYARLRAGASD